MALDVEQARRKVVDNLEDHGFRPRDADPTDFQYGDDRTLRFKVGTAYSEITVSIWHGKNQFRVHRATTPEQVVELNHTIDGYIRDWRENQS